MMYHFNYTERKPIDPESAKLRLVKSGDQPLLCDINLTLDSYDLPNDAELYLEFLDKYTYKRIGLGPLGSFKRVTKEIEGFTTEDALKYRLKVVDQTQKHGLLLAVMEGRATKDPLPDNYLLSFRPDDLGDIVYDVECSFNDDPVVLINKELQLDLKELANNPIFLGLAFPSIVKDILLQILFKHKIYDTEGDAWQHNWLRHIVNICGMPLPPDPDKEEASAEIPENGKPNDKLQEKLNEWIDDAIKAFFRHHHLLKKFEVTYSKAVEE